MSGDAYSVAVSVFVVILVPMLIVPLRASSGLVPSAFYLLIAEGRPTSMGIQYPLYPVLIERSESY